MHIDALKNICLVEISISNKNEFSNILTDDSGAEKTSSSST